MNTTTKSMSLGNFDPRIEPRYSGRVGRLNWWIIKTDKCDLELNHQAVNKIQ